MTRKKCVRMVMAAGLDRNSANRLANDVNRRGLPYAIAHRLLRRALTFLSVIQISGAHVSITLEDGCADQ